MKIGVIGLGLIGGSIAKALRSRTKQEVVGHDRCASTVEAARAEGAIQDALPLSGLSTCQALIVALPPLACLTFLREQAGQIAPGTLVVDCCGVKRSICSIGFELARERGFHFLGGHPMAGREVSGFKAAHAALFERAVMLLVPKEGENADIIRQGETLFLSMGFARIMLTSAEKHDEMIALTSQLAHLVSNAYVKSPRAQEHRGFSAGSFADLTRVARLNETLWTELFIENRDYLLRELDELTEALSAYRNALADKDSAHLCALLKKGCDCKEQQDDHRNPQRPD